METASIIGKIREIASRHASIQEVGIDDIKESELLEIEAENLIISYCEKMGYQIYGFSHNICLAPARQLVVLLKIGLCLNMVLCNEFRRFLPGLRKASDR